MKKYEIMTITKVSAGESGAVDIVNSLKDLISSLKGKVLDSKSLGKRSFAYKIDGDAEGYYDTIDFEIETSEMKSFNEKLGYMENLVRYLIVAV
jgi:ribosomal protein S6